MDAKQFFHNVILSFHAINLAPPVPRLKYLVALHPSHPLARARQVGPEQVANEHCLTGPRLKIRPLIPAPPLFVVGIAYRKDANSPTTANSVAAAKRAKSA